MATGVRRFPSGATRDVDDGKLDFEACLNPRVLTEFAAYMHGHRHLADGSLRAADEWQHGWSRDVSIKSLMRHVFDLWLLHRGEAIPRPEDGHVPTLESALGGVLFNVQAYWLQLIREREE